jgi:RNA polymerase sigma-70 factor (ECF subfamily)
VWCYRFTGSQDQAADLAQEIFLKAYTNLASFNGRAKFSTWLYSITMNHCRDNRDKRMVRREHFSESLTEDISVDDAFDRRLEQKQQMQTLRELMGTALNETEQKVLYLHYADEVRLDEITRLLRLDNPSGAKAHVVNARRKLAAALERLRNRSDSRRKM